MAVELAFGSFGNPDHPKLLILHGLLGSSRNWLTVGKELAKEYSVFALDLRNHGQSPHRDTISFKEMVDDLSYWLMHKQIEDFYLLGHSLGGKVAMAYACKYPTRVKGLIIEDIAPKKYGMRYKTEFDAMNALDLSAIEKRSDADDQLAKNIEDPVWRQFLLTNLVRNPKGFEWQIDLKALTNCLPDLMEDSLQETDIYEGKTLFLRGGKSDFIEDADEAKIKKHFPKATFETIAGAGHNVHVEGKDALVAAVLDFII